MKAKHYRKLTKALELIEQAQNMVEELAAADPDFGHSANSTYRGSRIAAAVSILRTEVEQFAPQEDAQREITIIREEREPQEPKTFVLVRE